MSAGIGFQDSEFSVVKRRNAQRRIIPGSLESSQFWGLARYQ